jgi:hypothetical protein
MADEGMGGGGGMISTPMRRCGKRYENAAEALRSKAGQVPGVEVAECRCGGVHLIKPPERRADGKPRKAVGGNTIPAKVCKQVDKRDGRRCVKCGSGRNLHRHHRRIKGQGGDARKCTDCACNLVILCWECHLWVHSSNGRREAEAEGLIIPRSTSEPGRISVLVHTEDGGLTRFPGCDGEYHDEPPQEVAA